jgi:hypothetical protein
VLKIDFDAPNIELALVDQILETPEVAALVDEVYFEHHVADAPHATYKYATPIEAGTRGASLAHSYELFSRLREAGIRAHSWI